MRPFALFAAFDASIENIRRRLRRKGHGDRLLVEPPAPLLALLFLDVDRVEAPGSASAVPARPLPKDPESSCDAARKFLSRD
jgi:hypothetical protein